MSLDATGFDVWSVKWDGKAFVVGMADGAVSSGDGSPW